MSSRYIFNKLKSIFSTSRLLSCYVKMCSICEAEKSFRYCSRTLFLSRMTSRSLQQKQKDLSSCQWWNNHEFVLGVSILLSLTIRSCHSIGNYKVAARRFPPFPVEMWRIVSGKIRFEVFTDKLCKSEERDNKVNILFRRESSSMRLAFLIFFFCTKRIAIQLKLQNSFNISMLLKWSFN